MNFKQCKNICVSVSFQWIIHLLVTTITEILLLFFSIWYLLKLLDFTSLYSFKISHMLTRVTSFSVEIYRTCKCFYSLLHFLGALTSGVTDFKAIYTVQIMYWAVLASLFFSSELCLHLHSTYMFDFWGFFCFGFFFVLGWVGFFPT